MMALLHTLTEFHRCCGKVMFFLSRQVRRATFANEYLIRGKEEKSGETCRAVECKSCNRTTSYDLPADSDVNGALTGKDIKAVMERLGLWSSDEEVQSWVEGVCGDCRLVGAACSLLEEKEASLQELEQAFSVFDRNGDGFVTPLELWRVLQMLGFDDGAKYQDCVSMIRPFDEDGDGRISLSEFKTMLQKTG